MRTLAFVAIIIFFIAASIANYFAYEQAINRSLGDALFYYRMQRSTAATDVAWMREAIIALIAGVAWFLARVKPT